MDNYLILKTILVPVDNKVCSAYIECKLRFKNLLNNRRKIAIAITLTPFGYNIKIK